MRLPWPLAVVAEKLTPAIRKEGTLMLEKKNGPSDGPASEAAMMLSTRIRLKSAHSRASGNADGRWRSAVRTQSHVLKLAFDRGVAEEAFMRTIPLAFIAFAALSLSTTGARADGSWCANYGTGHSGINCSYSSQQQCLASVSGVYGFCTPNPYPGTGYGRGGSWNLAPTARSRAYRAER